VTGGPGGERGPDGSGAATGWDGALRAAGDAFRFLTLLPLPGGRPAGTGEAAAAPSVHPWAMAFFPVVGLFLGAVVWTVSGVLGAFLPDGVTDLAALAVLAVITGAIHWDGLMDTADALGAPPARRLEVLRDVHVGSFGMLALVFVAGAQWAGLGALDGWVHGSALLLFPAWGRWLMGYVTYAMADLRRGHGLASPFVAQLEIRHILWGGLFVLVLSVLLVGIFRALVVLIGVLGTGIALRRLYFRAFGGVSGDLLGAACCVGEAAALWFLAAAA
jgi:adenosylcobinamide-GDP ribazoletransferase